LSLGINAGTPAPRTKPNHLHSTCRFRLAPPASANPIVRRTERFSRRAPEEKKNNLFVTALVTVFWLASIALGRTAVVADFQAPRIP